MLTHWTSLDDSVFLQRTACLRSRINSLHLRLPKWRNYGHIAYVQEGGKIRCISLLFKNASIFHKCQNMGKRQLEMCVYTKFPLCSINIGFPKCGLVVVFIRRKSHHWLLLSVTTWLTNSCLWDLNDVTLVDEYGKLQWQRKLGPKWDADVWLRFWGWIWFWGWFLVNVLKPKFGQE